MHKPQFDSIFVKKVRTNYFPSFLSMFFKAILPKGLIQIPDRCSKHLPASQESHY